MDTPRPSGQPTVHVIGHAGSPAAGQPVVRYYDVRPHRSRPWLYLAVGAVVALVVAGVWFGADLGAESPAQAGVVTVDGQFDEQAAAEGAVPIITDPASEDDRIDATSMAMVGDSITDGSADAIRYTLAAHGFATIDIDGVTSRRIEEGDGSGSPLSGIRTLYGMLGDPDIHPDVWVVALGTNDIGQYDDPAEYRRMIRAVIDMIPDETPLVWVDAYRADKPGPSAEFDEILVDEMSRREGGVVASWSDQAERDDETNVLRDDGVHPNQHGRVVFAALVAEGIAAVT